MSLLGFDLLALANLPASPPGRRALLGQSVGLALLALMSWWAAERIVDEPRLLAAIGDRTGGRGLHGLLGYGLTACPMVATWLGLAMAQRQLFEAPEIMLWRVAPLPAWRGAVQVLLRAGFLSLLWSAALAGPFVTALLLRSPAPPWVWPLLPFALVTCTVPLLAALLAVHVLLMRFLAGRVLRFVLAVLAALASSLFLIWLLLGLVGTAADGPAWTARTNDGVDRLPWTIDAAAQLLAAAAEGRFDLAALLQLVAWLAAACLAFTLAANCHARAHENHLAADSRPFVHRGRSWPTAVAGLVRRKEFAQVLQQPGALIGFLVFAVPVFGLMQRRVLVDAMLADRRLPLRLATVAAMLAQWFVAVLLVLYAHMGRLALWDGPQWSLYMASPTPPGAILRGKLAAIGVFLLWPLLLVAAAATQLLGADAVDLLHFLGFASGGSLAALGVIAIVGTWPRLMHPDVDGQILQGGKSFLAAILLVLCFEASVAPAIVGWAWARHVIGDGAPDRAVAALPWAIGAAIAYGAAVATTGVWIGTRNYRRLLAPR